MNKNLAVLAAVSTVCAPSLAQGTKSDYERAMSIDRRMNDKVFRDRVTPHWMPNGALWYRVGTAPGETEFVFADGPKGVRRAAFDHEKLAAALAAKLGKPVAAGKLPFSFIRLTPTTNEVFFNASGKTWRWNGKTLEESTERVAEETLPASRRVRPSRRTGVESGINFINRTAGDIKTFWSDSGGALKEFATIKPGEAFQQNTYSGHVWVAKDKNGAVLGVFEARDYESEAVVDGNFAPAEPPKTTSEPAKTPPFRAFIRDNNVWINENGQEIRLSQDGTAENPYRDRFFASPDGTKLVVMQIKPAQEHKVTIVESSPGNQVQPRLKVIDYLKPGDQIEKPRPRLFDVKARREIPVSNELFNNPWSINNLAWDADSSAFSFLYNQRGHQIVRLLRVDAQSGQAKPIIEETSKTFIDYSQKTYLKRLEKTNEILWASERDGWNHLYLFDARTGLKNQVTRGDWVVRQVEKIDEEKRQIWVRGLGMRAGQDPLFANLARVNFDGSGLQILTDGHGEHNYEFSPDGNWLLDTYSRADLPPITTLRDAQSGKLSCELEKADASPLLKSGFSFAEPFIAKGRDGQTDISGVIVKPSNFDATKKYPVIEQIYAGPHDYHTPKGFARFSGLRRMAELGFIMVQLDGMGTNWRSKAFHDVCYKNLRDGGFPDRIAWMKAAAQTRPWMDLSRVGVYGGSAGGQNALAALIWHGDFYKAAAADCGCHDNRMDKIWWNEAWMGWPVGPEYAANSNVVNAKNMRGKLLLTVGELDTNVDPASTMQVASELIKADKDFEFIVFPGGGHGSGESPYGQRRRMDFFVKNLLGIEPRAKD